MTRAAERRLPTGEPQPPSGEPRPPGADRAGPAPTGRPVREVVLPGRRRLVLRPEQPDDAAAVIALYDRLPEDELYCRFFTAHRPPDRFVEHMSHVSERGGFGLVAVVSGDRGRAELIGEAAYELLPNGDGELGIAVDGSYRGWLGPYLLDALLEQAAARGVPNVEAEVLLSNRRMLAVLKARGCVVLDHFLSPATLRVSVSTAAHAVPSWPGARDRPRLLVEIPGGQWTMAHALERKGFQVLACPGPDRGGPPCGPRAGRPCPLASGADVIVVAQPGEFGDLLGASHGRLHPHAAACSAGPDASRRAPDLPVLPADDAGVAATFLEDLVARHHT